MSRAMETEPVPTKPRVLAVHEDVGTLRLIRETLLEFTECEIDTSPNAEYAFELALQRSYALLIFNLTLPVLAGELLYGLISKAYTHCHAGARTAPPVVYVLDTHVSGRAAELQRDARVRAVLGKPLTIDRILECGKGILVRKTGL
jgi:DNA-binding response OmpR family regulator